jgi:hypothetical protein
VHSLDKYIYHWIDIKNILSVFYIMPVSRKNKRNTCKRCKRKSNRKKRTIKKMGGLWPWSKKNVNYDEDYENLLEKVHIEKKKAIMDVQNKSHPKPSDDLENEAKRAKEIEEAYARLYAMKEKYDKKRNPQLDEIYSAP